MRVAVPAWVAVVVLSVPAAGRAEDKPKEKPDPAKFGVRFELASAIEDKNDKNKALLALAGDAADAGRADLVRKCLAALPAFESAANDTVAEEITPVLRRLFGTAGDADAVAAAKSLTNARVRDRVLRGLVEGLAVGPDALWQAAAAGRDDQVRKLLDAKVPVNAKDAAGETALMKAAANGHVAAVKLLLSGGAELAEADAAGETAFMKACAAGHEAVFRAFWAHIQEYGKETFVRLMTASDRKGRTVLMRAAAGGHFRIVRGLRGAWIKEPFSSGEYIVPVDTTDPAGKTAADHAEAAGHKEEAELLRAPRGPAGKD